MESLGRRVDILAQINPGHVVVQQLRAERQPNGSIVPAFRKPNVSASKTVAIVGALALAAFIAAKYVDSRYF